MNRFLLLSLLMFFAIEKTPLLGQFNVCSTPEVPGADTFPGCLLCSSGVSGINDNFTSSDSGLVTSCGTIRKNFFFSLKANSEGKIGVDALIATCRTGDGFRAVLLDENGNEVSDCIELLSSVLSQKVEFEGLTPFESYSLMFDGIDGAICNYYIVPITSGNYPNEFPERPDSIIAPFPNFSELCIGLEFELSVPEVDYATYYDWQYPDFFKLIDQENNKANFKVESMATNILVSVVPYNECSRGQVSPSMHFTALEPIESREFISVCRGVLPVEYKGVTINGNRQEESELFKTDAGCDSSMILSVFVEEPLNQILDTAFCVGERFKFKSKIMDEPGFYEWIDSSSGVLFCDSSYQITLTRAGVEAPEITCVADTFLNLISFKWDEIPLVDEYEIFINDSLFSAQSTIGYFYRPNFPGEAIDVKIQPFNRRGCSFEPGFARCFAPNTTALAEKNLSNQIQIFPNPSSGIFQISSFSKIEKIEVFDFSGRRILIEKGEEVDLTNEASGVYVFKIFMEGGVGVRRVLKD